MCFLLFLALQTIHVLGCLLGIQDGFGFFFPLVSSIIWALIMTASFLSAVPKRLSNLLKLLTCFVLFLRSSSKFLCCLTSPMTMSSSHERALVVESFLHLTEPVYESFRGNLELSKEERSLPQFPLPLHLTRLQRLFFPWS